MPTDEEKQHRNELKQQLRTAAKAKFLAGLPVGLLLFRKLFDYLDQELTTQKCDDTLRLTEQFAEVHQVQAEPLKVWLAAHGGYCDCEVLANVEERFENLE